MRTILLILGVALLAGVIAVVVMIRQRRLSVRRRIMELHTIRADLSATERAAVFGERLYELDESPDADRPGAERIRAEIAFFLGCAQLGARNPFAAARMFQVAYHADPALHTALVLAFACLKVDEATLDALKARCHETWRELGSPNMPGSWRDRTLWEQAVENSDSDSPGSILRAWWP